MQKPIDLYLSLFSIAVGIIMQFLPKTLPVVIACLLVIYGLLVYPIWNFWYIERSLWLRLAALFFLAACLCVFGFMVLPEEKKDIFRCNFIITMKFSYPGAIFMVYPSALGNTMSTPNIALFLEVVNNRSTVARIFSYQCRALLRYDEGGVRVVRETPEGGFKYEYKPSGKIVEKWYNLHSMGFLGDNVYYMLNGLKKCRRLNFTQNSFDRLAHTVQLRSGESIMGWIFFEFDNEELRLQIPQIKEIELTLRNSAGESEICRGGGDTTTVDANSVISAGEWHIEPGEFDFTKEKFTMVPMVDLPKTLKEGGQFLKSKGKGKGYDVLNYQGHKNNE